MGSNTNHVIKDIDSSNLLSAYGVVLSKYYPEVDGGVMTPIGLISNISFSDSRPVTMQGEIGSKELFALINEGQKSLTFSRLLPFPKDNVWEAAQESGSTPIGSILAVLYADELLAEGASPAVIMYDIEQYDCFRKPIQLVLSMQTEEVDSPLLAQIWLKNASVSGVSIAIGAGSQQSMEPTQITWETTVELLDE